MKKIALILAVVLMLSLVLVACDNGTEESKATSDVVSTETSVEESTEVSEEESEEVSEEESKGPVYAEGTTEIDRTLTATVVTQGLTHNELTSTRGEGDGWAVVGDKLTNGITSTSGGDATVFFGTAAPVDVIIDLGEKVEGLADFYVHTVHGDWGISAISSVQYYVSDDGENWLPVAPAVLAEDCTALDTVDNWVAFDYKLELEKGVSAQYVKFSITPANHVWLGEVAAVVYK
jgi:predicted small secreted protein